MKHIAESQNAAKWPRKAVKYVECRKRDLVIRVADWHLDKDTSGFDVECYIGGVYDFNESHSFSKHQLHSMKACKAAAIQFAQSQIAKLL